MEVVYLNPEGVHESEKEAVSVLRDSLPGSWKGYASLELIDRKQGPSEMDLIIVTADRIIVVELKNWNGPLHSKNGHWFVGGDDRGRSPVKATALKSKKLAGKITTKLGTKLKNVPWVDYCVVLCGSSDNSSLPEDERDLVISLDEFKTIGNPKVYQKCFPYKVRAFRDSKDRPNQQLEVWDKFFTGNSPDFGPKVYSFNNYVVCGKALFSHRKGIYKEFQSQRKDNKNYKALMRRWDFNSPEVIEHAQTIEERKLIGFRESNVLGYIDSQDEDLKSIHLGLLHIPSPEEITADFCELYEWPSNRMRLDEFINKNRDKLDKSARLDLIQVLLSHISRLHEIDVAHRDLGRHSIWVALPSKITFSNFVTASYPDPSKKTMVSVRDILQAGRTEIPDDVLEDKNGTQYTRDVYLLGAVAHYIAYDVWPARIDGLYTWEERNNDPYESLLNDWFESSLEMDASLRFANVTVALHAFNEVHQRFSHSSSVDDAILTKHISEINVWTEYQPSPVVSKGTEMLLRSGDGNFGIKLWNGVPQILPSKSPNQELLGFLYRNQQLKNGALSCFPSISRFGYNPAMQAAFLVYEWIDGQTWSEWHSSLKSGDEVETACKNMLLALLELEKHGHSHGDIHPENVVLKNDENCGSSVPVLIDFAHLGQSNGKPYCKSYVPDNHHNLSVGSLDRYASVRMITEVAEKAESLKLYKYSKQLTLQPEITQGDIVRFADEFDALTAPSTFEATTIYAVKAQKIPEDFERDVRSDEGKYYVSVKEANLEDPNPVIRMFISGMSHQIDLHVDPENGDTKRIFLKNISHSQFIRNKNTCDIEIEGRISVEQSLHNNAKDLILAVLESPAISSKSESDNDEEKYLKTLSADGKTEVSAREIWSALAQTEEETYPSVVAVHDSERRRDERVIIQYGSENSVIDFDLKVDTVNVQREVRGEYRTVGVLEMNTMNLLQVRPTRGRFSIDAGESIRLESSLNASSLFKRRAAVETLTKNRSIIPNLPDFFSTDVKVSPQKFSEPPSDSELDLYTKRDSTGNVIFSLNENQREAFKKLYSHGPVGLLQGPPGTGKTAFISSFIHYAIENGAQNVLLVSQSHEAVNNAAEKVRELFDTQDKRIGIVRLGNEGQVSRGLEDVHELAIQDHYRERFRAEYRERLQSLASPLGLEKEFVNLCIEYEWGFASRLEKIGALSSIQDEEEAGKKVESAKARLLQKIELFLERSDINLDLRVDVGLISEQFYRSAVEKFQIDAQDSVDRLRQMLSLAREWLNVMSSSRANFQHFLVKTRNLVCGTCVGIGRSHYGVSENVYDWVVIDEAARSSAGELAIAMQVGRRVLLVGDHKQLPPMYDDAHLKAAQRILPRVPEPEMRRSDFERSFVSGYGEKIGQTLLFQYRMAPPIGGLVSACFYDGLLQTARGPADELFSTFPLDANSCVTWVDTAPAGASSYEDIARSHSDSNRTYVNNYEIKCVLSILASAISSDDLLEYMHGRDDTDPTIGVICMYNGQKNALIRRMNSITWSRELIEAGVVKIDTVDGYQGKENDVVILSLVRNNSRINEGFLGAGERINVALSRAKERLFIVGSSLMWDGYNENSPLSKVLKHIKEATPDEGLELLNAEKLMEAE
ncbi:AAA domain-containing protein [Pseudohalioglobus lutimaris]|uniref:Nuclease n=1 Tax=Pseudohalioglobus lutimaris TaxID=1737061 RepID=A0A2N5WXE1_9GAMM|nr:AAA domain-containing protein [Pseudohalioglobus lutimaris]PLW66905.1 hypothetical protein C0039_19415 [Pseudohalioglobus lutimaris]